VPALSNFQNLLVEHLSLLGPVGSRPQMGGYGLYLEDRCFGLIQGHRLYFVADAATQVEFRRRGLMPYDPNPSRPYGAFFEVPADVLDDLDQVLDWARRAVQVNAPAAG
jgi:DNA transformation protein